MKWQSAWLPNGSLVGYPNSHEYIGYDATTGKLVGWHHDELTWRDADYTWWEALRIDTFERGRSAAHLIWQGVDRNMLSVRRYPMFLVDTLDLLQHENIAAGYVRAEWRVVKRGKLRDCEG